MKKKVTIIGAGSVGATTAFALLARNAASEVVLIDINTDKALGEALDIKQATPFIDNCDIYAGSYCDAVDSDVVSSPRESEGSQDKHAWSWYRPM